MSGLDFKGGRPCRNQRERFAIGYMAGHADTCCERRPLWEVQGLSDVEHRARVPLYHEAWQLGREDAERGLRDVHRAWSRYQEGHRAKPRVGYKPADLETANEAVEIMRAVLLFLFVLLCVAGFGWAVAILDLL